MEARSKNTRSLTSQSAWILAAKVFGFVLNTLLPLLVVRYLTQENVGVYRQAFLVASNAVLVLPLGFSMSAYYFLHRDPEKHPAVILNILIFNFLMGAAAFGVLFVYPELLGSAFQNAELTRLAPLIGGVVWLWIFSGFLETAALALQQARLAAGFIVFSQLLKALLMVVAVVYFQSVDSLLLATLVLFAFQSVVMLAFLNRQFPRFWAGFDPAFFRRQLAYALPFGISVLLYVLQTDLHNYFVSHSFSASEFAIYSVGCFQLPLIAMLYESVGSVMIPRMSQMQAEGRKREMLTMTVAATEKLAFVYFPLFAFLMVVANEFITTLFTDQYAASSSIFRVNLLALPLFSLVVDPIARAYPSAGRFLLKVRVGICLFLLAIFWYGLGRFGLLEMIWTVVGAILFEKLVCAWISIRMLDASWKDALMLRPIGRIAMAASIAGGALFLLHLIASAPLRSICEAAAAQLLAMGHLQTGSAFLGGSLYLGICLALFTCVYIAAANFLGAVRAEDKEKVVRLLRRVSLRTAAGHTTM